MTTPLKAPPAELQPIPVTPTVEAWRVMTPAAKLDFQIRVIEALNAAAEANAAKARAEAAEARADASRARAAGVLAVLRARGLSASDAARERILAEEDTRRLDRWLEKAIVAASVDEVLGEGG